MSSWSAFPAETMMNIQSLVTLLRPHQWTKNGLCMAGVVFSGRLFDHARGRLFDWEAIGLGLLTTAAFCLGSSAVYVFNDILDRDRDRQHPKKRFRPVASGEISVAAAGVIAALLAATAVGGAWLLGPATCACLVLLLANNLAYTVSLKHQALFDVLCIAFGFVMRLLAGVYVLGEMPTAWITLCTFFLAVFLGFAKRRAELSSLNGGGSSQRPVLSQYTVEYLDSLLNNAATATILCYALFTVISDKNPTLIVTLPIVYYAILHYKRMVMVGNVGEEPDRVLLKDFQIGGCVALWLILYVAVTTFPNFQLFR